MSDPSGQFTDEKYNQNIVNLYPSMIVTILMQTHQTHHLLRDLTDVVTTISRRVSPEKQQIILLKLLMFQIL